MYVNFLLKMLKAKKRREIRAGKLWEITRVWGRDIQKVEIEPAKHEPIVRKAESKKVDSMRIHVLKAQDDVTNLTKNPDLL